MIERERDNRSEDTGKSSRGRFHNPTVRQLMYDALRHCYEGKCAICSVSEAEKELVIDHIDGNPLNWRFDNLRLLCKKHNATEYWRKLKRFNKLENDTITPQNMRERDNERAGLEDRDAERSMSIVASQGESTSAEIKINREKEPAFRGWVMTSLLMDGSMDVATAINGGAEKFSISPLTTRRYLNKMVSKVGYLCIASKGKGFANVLQIKAEYWESLSSAK